VNLSQPIVLLVGGEGPGLSADVVALSDERLTIPMKNPVESLNAAVTAAVVLYEARRQRRTPDGS
jgi:TrmH family RNA methyltransferase